MTTYAVRAEDIARIEADPPLWLLTLLPSYFTAKDGTHAPFAPHHLDLLRWAFAIALGLTPDPPAFISIWPRGQIKSTLAEAVIAQAGVRRRRRYALYVCDAQERADDHVGNVGAMLTAPAVELFYPGATADRRVGTVTSGLRRRAWRRNRLQLPGFTVDAIGLDSALRGARIEEDRPDLIVFDDIDRDLDSAIVTARKRRLLSRAIIPAASRDAAFLGVQNLVTSSGVFAAFARGTADLLLRRQLSGPIPALRGFNPQTGLERLADGTLRIVAGEPTWAGMGLGECEEYINAEGIESFMLERQHDTVAHDDRVFTTFDPAVHRYTYARLPEFAGFYGGLDFGGEGLTAHFSAGAVVAVTARRRRVLVETFRERGMNIAERQMRWMLSMQARWAPNGPPIRWAADRSQSAAIGLLRAAGFNIRPSRQGGEDNAGRESRIRALAAVLAVEALLRPGALRIEGPQQPLPGFFYLPALQDFEDEMLAYRREAPPDPSVPSARRPIRTNDDLIDSVLYAEELIARTLVAGVDAEPAPLTVRV